MNGQYTIEIQPETTALVLRPDGQELEELVTGPAVTFSRYFRNLQGELRGAPLSVFINIALRITQRGTAWPSVAQVAEETRYSETEVRHALKTLEAQGLLTIQRRNGARSTYQVTQVAAAGARSPLIQRRYALKRGRGGRPVDPRSFRRGDIGDTPAENNRGDTHDTPNLRETYDSPTTASLERRAPYILCSDSVKDLVEESSSGPEPGGKQELSEDGGFSFDQGPLASLAVQPTVAPDAGPTSASHEREGHKPASASSLVDPFDGTLLIGPYAPHDAPPRLVIGAPARSVFEPEVGAAHLTGQPAPAPVSSAVGETGEYDPFANYDPQALPALPTFVTGKPAAPPRVAGPAGELAWDQLPGGDGTGILPRNKHANLKHPAVVAWKRLLKPRSTNYEQRAAVAAKVGDDYPNLERWGQVLLYWRECNYNPSNVPGLLELYGNWQGGPPRRGRAQPAVNPHTVLPDSGNWQPILPAEAPGPAFG